MANTTILTTTEFKQRVSPDMNTTRDTELQAVINAAALWFRRVFGWEVEQATRTVYLNGVDRVGPSDNILYLPGEYRPVIHTGGDLQTVTESGTSLTVAVGYDTSADVYLVGANVEKRCQLVKPNSSWTRDWQNVVVVGKMGYASASIPEDVKQVVAEVATLMFRSPELIGKAARSTKGGSASFEKDLLPHTRIYLDKLRERIV